MSLRVLQQGLLLIALLPLAVNAAQQISLSPGNQQASPGQSFEVSLSYSADSETLTGVGVQLYYDSSKLQLTGLHSIYEGGKLAVDKQSKPDSKNADGDASTDKVINAAWFDLGGNWPGVSTTPLNLYTATFIASDFSGNSSLNLTGKAASRQTLQLGSTSIVGLGTGAGSGDSGGNTGSGSDQPGNDGGAGNNDSGDNSGNGSGDSAGSGGTDTGSDDSNSTDSTDSNDNDAGQGGTNGGNTDPGSGNNNNGDTGSDNNGNSSGSTQRLSLTPQKQEVAANQSFEVALKYSADSAKLAGVGAQLYFDSSQIQFNEIRAIYAGGKLAVDNQPKADSNNADGLTATDKTINAAWFDLSGGWPGESVNQPVTLYIVRFTAVAGFNGESTINLSGRPASGQKVELAPAVVTFKKDQTGSSGNGTDNGAGGNQSGNSNGSDNPPGNDNTTDNGNVRGDSGSQNDEGRKKSGSLSWMMILALGLFGLFRLFRTNRTDRTKY